MVIKLVSVSHYIHYVYIMQTTTYMYTHPQMLGEDPHVKIQV